MVVRMVRRVVLCMVVFGAREQRSFGVSLFGILRFVFEV